MKLDKKAVLLALGSVVFALLVCELGVRLFTSYGPHSAEEAGASSNFPPADTGGRTLPHGLCDFR